MLKKLLYIFGAIILVLVVLLIGAYYYFVKLPLPMTNGEIRLQGLEAPVEVLRDPWGVPHIYAKSNHDLLFAQGFVQAQDRLWQMEINRRLASGRLSEVIGPETLSIDRLLRTFGIMRAAHKEIATLNEDEKELLQAFANGVNAFIASRKGRLPLEFRVLGVNPEPWRPEDSIGWAKVMAFMGGANWEDEIVKATLRQRLGSEKAATLFRLNQPGTPFTIPSGLDLFTLWPFNPLKRSAFLPSLGGASNNWAVHGSRTKTGSPLLANDMHLDVRIPSIWYEMHLSGGDFNVVGLSLPGVPLVIAGHNEDVAWGITFALTDTQDLFWEQLNPNQKDQYLYKGQWKQAKHIKEFIKVKERDEPIIQDVLETIHGPIISSNIPMTKGFEYALSLKWGAHDPGGMIPSITRMNRAGDLEAFKEAALQWPDPAINLVCADRNGKIGYILAGKIPIRPQGHGNGPFPGWTGEHDWTGYLPNNEKPFLFNPVNGFIATANNRVVGDDYPYYMANDYMPGYRLERIQEVLAQKPRVSKDDFRTLQGDFKSLEAARFIDALQKMEGRSPEAKDLLKRLRSWDRFLGPDSPQGAIYPVLFYRLLENTFKDELGDLKERFFGVGVTPLNPINMFAIHCRVILMNLINNPNSTWFDDVRTPEAEGLNHMLERSLNETDSFLKQTLGTDPSNWRWGRLHRIEFQHSLGQVKPLDKILNLGPFEVGGHFSTVWQSTLLPGMDFNCTGWTVSNRHIYDLEDWDKSHGSIVPGQSGMFGSPHYSDQVEFWLTVDHHPLYFSRVKVEAETKQRLILKP